MGPLSVRPERIAMYRTLLLCAAITVASLGAGLALAAGPPVAPLDRLVLVELGLATSDVDAVANDCDALSTPIEARCLAEPAMLDLRLPDRVADRVADRCWLPAPYTREKQLGIAPIPVAFPGCHPIRDSPPE